jgi:hypothetical protein
VQGTDYVFTIQGWIKGVNSNVLDRDKNIGKDGHAVNATNYIASQQGIHSSFGTDAYGYTLDYFWNNTTGNRDYKPINTNAQTLYNDAPNATSGVNDLYNGNIKGMAVALQKPNGTALPQNLGLVYNQYKYDQLNRITLHQVFTGTSTTAYASLSNTNEYRNVFSYDANGQLTGDAAEQIANIQWTVYGKIATINRTAGSSKKNLPLSTLHSASG